MSETHMPMPFLTLPTSLLCQSCFGQNKALNYGRSVLTVLTGIMYPCQTLFRGEKSLYVTVLFSGSFFKLLFLMYLCACVHVHGSACREEKRALDPLEWELEVLRAAQCRSWAQAVCREQVLHSWALTNCSVSSSVALTPAASFKNWYISNSEGSASPRTCA